MTADAWRRLGVNDFALELTALRAERGLSWDELARRSGVSRTYIRDLSAGRGSAIPSERVVLAIAAALEVKPDHFRLTRARAIISSPKIVDAIYAKLPKKAA